jgi:hypothetical protein
MQQCSFQLSAFAFCFLLSLASGLAGDGVQRMPKRAMPAASSGLASASRRAMIGVASGDPADILLLNVDGKPDRR